MGSRWTGLLKETGAMQQGHFLLSSGRHSEQYVQCALALRCPADAIQLGMAVVEALGSALKTGIDCIVAPPLGGILIGYELARQLDRPFVFPERADDGHLVLRRGFSLEPGMRVCIVEDVITTGRTTREVIELVRAAHAVPVALAAIIDRSADHTIDSLSIASVVQLQIPTYEAEDCPLCAKGIPLVKPGSRRETKEAQR